MSHCDFAIPHPFPIIAHGHLAFVQDEIDWQIWIQAGPRPVPRKLVITYKNEPGSPQYVARLFGWDFQPRLAEEFATFHAPAGSDQIDFLPAELAEPIEPDEALEPDEPVEPDESVQPEEIAK